MTYPSSSLIGYIYKMAGAHRDNTSSDAELLSRYAATQDERAFSALMIRHGVMVWDICFRILRNAQDVEEAYQSTFLALAQKAKKIRVSETLVGWLHQVAHRTAVTARRRGIVRQTLSDNVKILAHAESVAESKHEEIFEELHGEIAKMPEKLRVAVVLHYFEGKTQKEVASILGVTESAVRARLNRGEAFLEKRLTSRGLGVGAVTVGSLLRETVSQATMPPGLVSKTMKAATAFRDGKLSGGLAKLAQVALKHAPSTKPWWKNGWMITILCVTGLGAGAGAIARKTKFPGISAESSAIALKPEPASQSKKDNPKPPRLDLYGDPLPHGAIARLGTTRFRLFDGGIMKYPRDFNSTSRIKFIGNELLLIADGDCPVRLAETTTGRVMRKFGSDVKDFALSKNERMLITRSRGSQGVLSQWDLDSGKLLRKISVANDGSGTALAISPDGKMIASPGPSTRKPGPRGKEIHFWDALTGKHLQSIILEPKQDSILFLAFSSDSKSLIGADQNEIRVWDVVLGKAIRRFGSKQRLCIKSFVSSPDGRLAAVGYGPSPSQPGAFSSAPQKGPAYIWDIESGRQLQQPVESTSDVTAVAFTPDGKKFATGHSAGDVLLRDVASGKELRRFAGCQGNAQCLAFSPDGNIIAAGAEWEDQLIHLWDVKTGREISPAYPGHKTCILASAFARNGADVVSLGCDGECHVWDAEKGIPRAPITELFESKRHKCISGTVSSDGKSVAIVELKWPNASRPNASIKLLRRADDRKNDVISSSQVPAGLAIFLALSPDGKKLACAGWFPPAGIVLVDTATRRITNRMERVGVGSAFSADGNILAAMTSDSGDTAGKGVVVWDVKKTVKVNSFSASDACLSSVCFSPDGCMLITADLGGKIKLWDWQSARNETNQLANCRQEIAFQGNIWSKVVCSPDGNTIAASDKDNIIHLLEISTGRERIRFRGHECPISSLVFSPDGRRLMSGSRDTTLLIWDITGHLENGRLREAILSNQDIELLWKQMAGRDAVSAGRALWTLVAAGSPAVVFLGNHLQAASPNEIQVMLKLIAKLDDESFTVRRQARQRLTELGSIVEDELRRALQSNLSVEQRSVLGQILEIIHDASGLGPGEEVRALRGIEVLEQIGGSEGCLILERLAAGRSEARRTQAARMALKRLKAASGS